MHLVHFRSSRSEKQGCDFVNSEYLSTIPHYERLLHAWQASDIRSCMIALALIQDQKYFDFKIFRSGPTTFGPDPRSYGKARNTSMYGKTIQQVAMFLNSLASAHQCSGLEASVV